MNRISLNLYYIPEEIKFCQICYEENTKIKISKKVCDCQVSICTSCLSDWFVKCIQDIGFIGYKINCPQEDCTQQIHMTKIESLFAEDKSAIDKIYFQLFKLYIRKSYEVFQCPKCEEAGFNENFDCKNLICRYCNSNWKRDGRQSLSWSGLFNFSNIMS